MGLGPTLHDLAVPGKIARSYAPVNAWAGSGRDSGHTRQYLLCYVKFSLWEQETSVKRATANKRLIAGWDAAHLLKILGQERRDGPAYQTCSRVTW